MNSTTSLVARQYRLQQWADQIRECQNRSAGVSVKEWCNQHELTAANYYYRLREVRKACLDHISYNAIPQSIVPVPTELMSGDLRSVSASGLKVSINNICIRVTNETSPELLKMVLQVAADVK
ncbi:MAG: IS66 family insertion sequence element accessory protein TnpB [Paenibacillaceae bacterium]|nr:IS66 family insertion sequence element accessory protein TnpB [Paenibacillaceae bacterium]